MLKALSLGVLSLGIIQAVTLINPNDARLDKTAPSVTISTPTSSSTYDAGTDATLTTLSGTSSDATGVALCTWVNDLGGSGTATTTGSGGWSVSNLSLTVGDNAITVTCRDPGGNSGTDVLTVTRTSGSCTTTISSGSSLATALTNVANGGTVCLNAGTYTFNASVTKSSMTMSRPADGVSRSQVTLTTINTNSSQYLRFHNVTTGTGGHEIGSGSVHIQLTDIDFNGPLCIRPTSANRDWLIDGSIFDGLGEACNEGRLGIVGSGSPNGVTISNNHFGGGGASDGIQLTGNAAGTVIGPGNVFEDIQGCGAIHCDAIQGYFAEDMTLTGNYFGGNMDGGHLAGFDCNWGPITATNNVFKDTGADQVDIGLSGVNGDSWIHNTMGPNVTFQIYGGNPGNCTNSNMTIRNNAIRGSCQLSQLGSGNTIDYNTNTTSNCRGSNGVNGNPTFVGGTDPTTWAGWELSSGSPGENAASDALDAGITSYGTGPWAWHILLQPGLLARRFAAGAWVAQHPGLQNAARFAAARQRVVRQ